MEAINQPTENEKIYTNAEYIKMIKKHFFINGIEYDKRNIYKSVVVFS